jgi:predicted O-methyltransferase YrrM
MLAGGIAVLTSLTERETQRLTELAEDKRVLEVGSAYGFSAITMALVAASVVAVDPHAGGDDAEADSFDVMTANLQQTGMQDKVVIRRGRSQDELPKLFKAGERFDLIFIDGDHSFQAARKDLLNALMLLAPGGVLAVHDYGEQSTPDVPRAVDDVFPDGPHRLTDSLWEVHKS